MPRSIRQLPRVLVALVVLTTMAVVPAAAAPPSASAAEPIRQPIEGQGSTWSANALTQWIRNVFDNYSWKISYSATGSSAGRQAFAQGTMDFGVSEIPYALANSDSPDPKPARSFAYVPIVAGGTAFMYNLVIGGQRVTNLRLSGENVTKIFTGVITKWNDPAIAVDNPKLSLPAITIVPVVRSDGSGTTAQLTTWMRSQYPSLWSDYCARAGRANCGITSNYPVISGSAFLAQVGSDQLAATVAKSSSVGAITYVEASYAINAHFPLAKLLNAAGYYNEPTASNVSVSLLAAKINGDSTSQEYLTANLADVYTNPDPRVYPLSSYSYMIVPTAIEGNFTADKGRTLADFASYFLCEGQQQADVLGYSPLPKNLVEGGLAQVALIPGGDPVVKPLAACNNPTFSSDGTNKLANEAPQPQECDKKGADQCLTGTGGAAETVTAASSSSSTTTSVSATSGSNSSSSGSASGAAAQSTTGEATGLASGGVVVVNGQPVSLDTKTLPFPTLMFMLFAAVLVLSAIFMPPMIARRREHRLAMAGAAGAARKRKRIGAPRLRMKIPKVNLPARFRKSGSATAPTKDS